MEISIFRLESLKIDSLRYRWVARLLFLLLFGVCFWVNYAPPGSSDFTELTYWMNHYYESEDPTGYLMSNPILSVISVENIYYVFTVFVYYLFLFVVVRFYNVLYVGMERGMTVDKCIRVFMNRSGWAILTVSMIVIMGFFVFSFAPFILIFIIPAGYNLWNNIYFGKTDPLSAFMASVKQTMGHKLSIFIELVGLTIVYLGIMYLIRLLFNELSIGAILVYSFINAFFWLSIARNMGVRYQHPIPLIRNEEM